MRELSIIVALVLTSLHASGGYPMQLTFANVAAVLFSSASPIRVGVEYAFSGVEADFADAGVHAVKYLPLTYSWGKMQTDATSPIDFTVTDRYVLRYQDAGTHVLTIVF